ncbi:aldo/keto reductase [Micrococcus lylae]|uniref:aldo/keto reductase n=1 Tax=Micrococcus lylae TaxID=1273 RepID=UPI003EBA528D
MENTVPATALPALGLGTYKLTGPEGQAAIERALALGYRHLDTAQAYGNEAVVGAALRAAGVPREAVQVTTKLTADAFGPADRVRASLEGSLERLGLDRVDLVLIHWPNPWRTAQEGTFRQTAAALAGMVGDDGPAASWGVSNFLPEHLDALAADGLRAAVNQIQVDALVQQRSVQEATRAHGAAVVAHTPLGRGGEPFEVPAVTAAAAAHGATPAQVLLAWHRQSGRVAIPRSGSAAHLAENLASLELELTADELAAVDAADSGRPARQDPLEFGI